MDREFFVTSVRSHSKAMFRAARACTASDADAEDAVGEAVLRAWKSADRLRDGAAVRSWLIKISVNCAHEARRKVGREIPTEDLEPLGGTTELEPPSGLWEAVCRLPQEQRAVVTLFYYEDMAEKEIAKVLGVAQGTVKSRLSRARAALKKMLGEEGRP